MRIDTDPRSLYVPYLRPHASSVVYSIAHAGAGAAPWASVAKYLPEAVELRALRLPGRENRFRTPAHTSMASVIAEYRSVIDSDVLVHGRSVYLVGSCFGALVAVALAGALDSRVDGLLALRQPIPDNLDAPDSPATLDRNGLQQWVRDRQITPVSVLEGGMFSFFEPTLRADLSVAEGYRFAGVVRNMPVHLVYSRRGGAVPDFEAWQRVSTGLVRRIFLDSAGDPLTERPSDLAGMIVRLIGDSVQESDERHEVKNA